jgi:hypothetical protein
VVLTDGHIEGTVVAIVIKQCPKSVFSVRQVVNRFVEVLWHCMIAGSMILQQKHKVFRAFPAFKGSYWPKCVTSALVCVTLAFLMQ